MTYRNINDLLAEFIPISLQEMEAVALMERQDAKYALKADLLPELIAGLRPFYRVLEHAGTRITKYETLYFDSADYGLYARHHMGRATRFKVRARRYVESDSCFFEIKHKTNKDRTVKNRVRAARIDQTVPPEAGDLLANLTGLTPADIKGSVWVDYGRMTLVSKTTLERLTINVDLAFRIGERMIRVPEIVIVELKRDKLGMGSPALDVLRRLRIKPKSMSKYCLGVALLAEPVKMNNFKQELRSLQKFSHAV